MSERRLIQGVTIEADSVVVKGADFDALCALARENEQLRAKLDYANREAPHCPSCSCEPQEAEHD